MGIQWIEKYMFLGCVWTWEISCFKWQQEKTDTRRMMINYIMEFRGTLFHPNGSRSRHENFAGLFLGSICFLFCDFAAFGKLTWRGSRVFPNRANHQKGTFQQMMRIPRVVQLNCPMNFTKWKGAELLALPELFLLSLPAVSKLFLLFSSFPAP